MNVAVFFSGMLQYKYTHVQYKINVLGPRCTHSMIRVKEGGGGGSTILNEAVKMNNL